MAWPTVEPHTFLCPVSVPTRGTIPGPGWRPARLRVGRAPGLQEPPWRCPDPEWLCSFGIFPVRVSVLAACFDGTSPSTSRTVPTALPSPWPQDSTQPHGRGMLPSESEPFVGVAGQAGIPRKGDLQPQLDSALQDVNDMYLLLEETEKQAVRRALIEERGRFCTFITFLQPVVVGLLGTRRPQRGPDKTCFSRADSLLPQNGELTMLGEITHLQGIIDDLVVLTAEPHKLPPASEQVIKDLKGSDYSWSYQTPPSSPSSSSSRKSSMCRLDIQGLGEARHSDQLLPQREEGPGPAEALQTLGGWPSTVKGLIAGDSHERGRGWEASGAPSSSSSAKGGGAPWPGGAQTYSPSSTCRYRSLAQPATTTTRLSSVSSHDSGFVSQDATYSKPPSPMPSDITSQDWSKVGSHEQPSGATLQRRKDRVELLRDTEPGPASGGTLGPSGEEAPRPRMSPATIAAKVSARRPSSNYLVGLPGVCAEGTGGCKASACNFSPSAWRGGVPRSQ
ncbi:Protein MTSS 2 [Saguinus oedipus]|uniref:Protein MTSS 2 n=1 Tax=Saguinus oedipus TaxID=9490 RepID=A0ABQ9TKX8_SAGOE|nr:Protein MTSS 2 [Saguinus oedipus]